MKSLREKLGLTQIEMGKLIGIGKTKANLFEKGERTLTSQQLALMTEIELLMEQPPNLEAVEELHLLEQEKLTSTIKKLTLRAKKATRVIQDHKDELAKMESMYNKSQLLLVLVNKLKITNKDRPLGLAYLNLLEIQTLEKLDSCGIRNQVLMKYKIGSLECEISSANTIIAEITPLLLPIPKEI